LSLIQSIAWVLSWREWNSKQVLSEEKKVTRVTPTPKCCHPPPTNHQLQLALIDLLTRTRSVSRERREDQSNLISSCTRTSSSDPRLHHSSTSAGRLGSVRHPIITFRFSCRKPCICGRRRRAHIRGIKD